MGIAPENTNTNENAAKPSRRRFLKGGLATAVGLAGYAFGVEPRWVATEHHDLPIAGLPNHLVGKRAVQISDIHVGDRVSDSYLLSQFEYVDSLSPDYVLFTGDYLDNSTDWHLAQGLRLMDRFPRGKLGTASVLGNHDYGGHGGHDQAIKDRNSTRLIACLKEHGLNPLLDETIEFDGLTIAGLRDFWHGGFEASAARDTVLSVKDRAAIVLSHNPDTADVPIWDGYRNWILCGHTHGGQCRFPLIGAPLVPVANRTYVSGKYEVAGGHRMYINRGIGHVQKVRFMARPEVTVFTLSAV